MKKIFTIASLFLSSGLLAQSNNELKSLIQKSFEYFPRVKEVAAASDISARRVELAQQNYLPSVGGIATYNYLNPVSKIVQQTGPGTEKVLQFQPFNNYNFNVGVTQLLTDFGKTKTQIEKAKNDLQIATGNIELTKTNLAAQVATVYYSLVYLKQAIRAEDEIIRFLRESKTIVENRMKRGDALQVDLYNIQSIIDQEENRKVDFRNLLEKQMALLEYTTGTQPEPSDTSLNFLSATEMTADHLTSAMQSNIEIQLAAKKVFSGELEVNQARQNMTPTLNLVGGTGFRNGYQPVIDDIRFNYMVGASLSVPIYQGGKLRKSVQIARESLRSSEYARQTAEATVQKDFKQVLSDLQASEERLSNIRGQLQYTGEALELTRKRYNLGVASYLDLIAASSNHQRARLTEIQSRYQQCAARIEWARLEGLKYWE